MSDNETFVADVRRFTESVGCTTDRFNARQTALYIGLQLEEMAEKLEACFQSDTAITIAMRKVGDMFKAGEYDHRVEAANLAAMLDADIDLAWVTIGSALSQGADVLGAMREVARANLAKLVVCDECGGSGFIVDATDETCDCHGCGCRGLVAVKDANGKVKKPEGWTAPDITPFICGGGA